MTARMMLVMLVVSPNWINAWAAEWVMDPNNSNLEFVATYESMEAPGSFKHFDVRLRFDPLSLQNSQLEVSIDMSSADMGSDDINSTIVQKEWLHIAQYPKAYFRSNKILKNAMGDYSAQGILSLKGIERQVNVPFSWKEAGDKSRMQGEFVVNRTNFNIGTGEWSDGNVIDTDIKVAFRLELVWAER